MTWIEVVLMRSSEPVELRMEVKGGRVQWQICKDIGERKRELGQHFFFPAEG